MIDEAVTVPNKSCNMNIFPPIKKHLQMMFHHSQATVKMVPTMVAQ